MAIRIAYTDFWREALEENLLGSFPIIGILRENFDLVEDYENPDVVLCSLFGADALKYDCPRVLYIGEAVSANFSDYDYVIGCDHLSYPLRYLRIPPYFIRGNSDEIMSAAREKHLLPAEFFSEKDRFCAFLVSAVQNDCSGRGNFFRALCKRKHVDSGGRYLNNMGGVQPDDKQAFLRSYRFNIAFENTIMDGYVTEKISEALAAGCIPIYRGSPSVELDFNPGSFINVADFSSFEECIDYVLYVDEHPEVYESIIRTPAFKDDQQLDRIYRQKVIDFFQQIFSNLDVKRRSCGPAEKKYRENRLRVEAQNYPLIMQELKQKDSPIIRAKRAIKKRLNG